MFNPLTPSEVVLAIGRAAREAARNDEPASDFSRGQLLSAFSASRHLSVELASYEPELRAFDAELAAAIEVAADATASGPALRDLAAALREASTAHASGDAVCRVLELLRTDDAPAATELRRTVHGALRRLVDREVELLAEVIEGAAKQ